MTAGMSTKHSTEKSKVLTSQGANRVASSSWGQSRHLKYSPMK